MSEGLDDANGFLQDHRIRPAAEGAVEIAPGAEPRSATILPLIVLYQRAWELAHDTEQSLGRLERAAEAAALAEAVLYLLAEAGDREGYTR